ncbi:MAG: AMP-binding protein, partial [bacterium]|nr:AMP-binding protein [bacterium]
NKISYIKLTPSLFSLMINNPYFSGDMFERLRLIVLGGEAIDLVDVERIRLLCPHVRVINHYGPTEATIGCIAQFLDFNRFRQYKNNPTIGQPIHNCQAFILNNHLKPLPVGVPGELAIAGIGLARGYLNQPELSADRFLSNPFANKKTGIMYRSGDLARWLPDGSIEFLGRKDHQVKIRGYRIEPGEIENKLKKYRGISDVEPFPGTAVPNYQLKRESIRCSRCLLPANYPGIRFNEAGICNTCLEFDKFKTHTKRYFKTMDDLYGKVEELKKKRRSDSQYDCLLLFSG